MNLLGFTDRIFKAQDDKRQTEKIKQQGTQFKLAGNLTPAITITLAVAALAVCNVGLFLSIIPNWYRWLFALLAVSAEALLGYCLHSYLRTTGAHKAACAICGALLLLFSLVHGGYFGWRILVGGAFPAFVLTYVHNFAWIILSVLVIGCGLALYLSHWRAEIAANEATERIQTTKSAAKLANESERMEHEAALARARLEHMKGQIALGNESADLIVTYAQMRARQQRSLAQIPDKDLRDEIANDLQVTLPDKPASLPVITPGRDADKGNGLGKF